ncbi:MAG: sulfotransferase [Defluviimonas sp.]|uniref:sulfotransferase family protein n=1 Tax=Albidovulum sp. TaxID=1872424 RepID=UPI001DBBC9C8|nr:sulfotransferase [Paracoccaceae bacterium]MCC0063318.1 sulfotransferase [Defluviimonas sp.]
MLTQPIILMCSERSGSNLVTRIFDAHPEVCAPGASHLFKVMSECACRYGAGSDELRAAVLDLFEAKVSGWRIDAWPRARRAAVLEPLARAGEMAAALYAAEAAEAGKPHLFLKENSAYRYLHFLQGQSHAPRYLFMVRDPRDMALSWRNGPVMRGGVLRASDRWASDQGGYLDAVAQMPADARVAFLRYEDLIAAPEAEIERVCTALGLAYDPRMAAFHAHSEGAKGDAKRSSMWSNLDKPVLSDNARKFLKELDDDEIAYVEARAGTMLESFGYASVRAGKPPFGGCETLAELRVLLAPREPHDKPAYQALDATERQRFEAWSALYARMTARPSLGPEALIGTAG